MLSSKPSLLVLALVLIAAVFVVVLRPEPEPSAQITDPDGESISMLDIIDMHHFTLRGDTFDFSTEKDFPNPVLNPDFDPGIFELGPNWGRIEPLGTWAIGERSLMRVHFREPKNRDLMIQCKARNHPETNEIQTISVSCNGHKCGTISVSRFMHKHTLTIPEEVQTEGENTFIFRYGFQVSPLEFGFGQDPRKLAVLFKKIGFREDKAIDETPLSTQDISIDKANDTITFVESREHIFPVSLPPTATELTFGLSFSHNREQSAPEVRISAEFLDGSRAKLYEYRATTIDEKHGDNSETADLSAIRGQNCFLIFEVDTGSESGATVTISSPTIRLDKSTEQYTPGNDSEPESEDPNHPDIVLVILDAARAHNFGCYAYSKDTTPNIDEFADGALIFNNAFALAPYTLCSVPTMITGESFLDHGVVQHRDRLNQEWSTLAEVLQSNGYRTVSYSATPNNSRAKGFDQGFDEFHELWKGVNEVKGRDPHRLSAMAEEMLNTDDGEKPLFLQLHYIPPHEPYDPGPDFDIFGDPNYTGSCDGSLETADSINKGRYLANADDINEIVSLYDGNLRKGDDALAPVFNALKSRGKWEQTIVLITSDHGEAFQEHGWIGHNENCYDEMLHVPFILKLPNDTVTGAIDPEQLITLADIKPTLCALAKCDSTESSSGINIFAELQSPKNRRNRLFVSRNSYVRPEFALRTLKWKLIMNRTGTGELYDIIADPSETANRILDDPVRFSGLLELMRRRLMKTTKNLESEEIEEISDEDKAMLEALGYLD